MALKVMDQAYRDAWAICEPDCDRQFQPGVTTEKEELQEEKDKLVDWLLMSAPLPGSVFWWGALSGMSYDDIDEYREALLTALDEHKDFV